MTTHICDKDFTVTVWSGNTEISFDIDEYTEDTDTEYIYVDENGNILSEDPNPMNYDYVTDCANDFLEWVKDMNSLKALSEASTESSVTAASENTATIFQGVSATFTPTLHVEPRKYYFTDGGFKRQFTHKAWHRDTSINFSILSVHSFSDGYDYYVFKVTGNTDTSKQYAHLSYMGYFAQKNRVIEGMTKDKDCKLSCDNILGYNYKFQYTAQLMSGKTPVGVVLVSAPDTNNNSTKVNKGFNFTLDGGITGGLSAKDGLKGDISIKPKWEWESKEEYTVTDYQCANISSEGATEGGGAFLFVGNSGRRDWIYDWSKTQSDYTLPRPSTSQ